MSVLETNKSFDSVRFFIAPREAAMRTRNVLVRMATKPRDGGFETAPQTLSFERPLLSPFLVVFRGILGRDFGTHQALPEDHGAGVSGRL